MQRSNDLVAFLNQSKYQEIIDSLYSELVLLKTDIRAKLGDVESYAMAFLQQTKCMMKYILEEDDLLASIGSKSYMDRIYLGGDKPLQRLMSDDAVDLQPFCSKYLDLDEMCLFCFDHLAAVFDRESLDMDPENPLKLHELGLVNSHFVTTLVTGLQTQPNWQFFTLASYYWRLHGIASQAVECARRALYLVPREFKDIPLLSLGTILQRSRQHSDAKIVLEMATEFNRQSAENYFALGNSLFFLSQFNKSMEAYDRSRDLDDAFKARVDYIENALRCFEQAKSKREFNVLFNEISGQLVRYGEKKELLEEYLKKMLRQQVPLDERDYFKGADGNENLAELVQRRGQFCSTRISAETNEPELFCDFVYDIHMKLESDDIRVDVIQTYLEQTAEVMRTAKGSLGVFDHLDLGQLNGDRRESGRVTDSDPAGQAESQARSG